MFNWKITWWQYFHSLNSRITHTPLDKTLIRVWKNRKINLDQDWKNLEYIVIDTETTALNAKQGELLSIGWVIIKNGECPLTDARHFYLKGLLSKNDSVGDSATIHQIRDCELQSGRFIEDVVPMLLKACENRILVFHHARLDFQFLNKYIQHLMGAPLAVPHIDTLKLEKAKLIRQKDALEKNDLTLAHCRMRYGLPKYPAHNALNDAMATAELLLAQISYKGRYVKARELIAR